VHVVAPIAVHRKGIDSRVASRTRA
jgi:hypothetical protein